MSLSGLKAFFRRTEPDATPEIASHRHLLKETRRRLRALDCVADHPMTPAADLTLWKNRTACNVKCFVRSDAFGARDLGTFLEFCRRDAADLLGKRGMATIFVAGFPLDDATRTAIAEREVVFVHFTGLGAIIDVLSYEDDKVPDFDANQRLFAAGIPNIALKLASFHSHAGDPGRALPWAEQAALRQPGPAALITLGMIYSRLGRNEEARQTLIRARKLAPDNEDLEGMLQKLER